MRRMTLTYMPRRQPELEKSVLRCKNGKVSPYLIAERRVPELLGWPTIANTHTHAHLTALFPGLPGSA